MSDIKQIYNEVDGNDYYIVGKAKKNTGAYTPLRNVTQETETFPHETHICMGDIDKDVSLVLCHGKDIEVSLAGAFNRTYKLVFVGVHGDTKVGFPPNMFVDQRKTSERTVLQVNQGESRIVTISVSKTAGEVTAVLEITALTNEWPTTAGRVSFNDSYFQADFDRLLTKDPNTIYFIKDTRRIYKGAQLYSSSGGIIYNFKDVAGGWTVSGSDGSIYTHKDGSSILIAVNDKIITTEGEKRLNVAKPGFMVGVNEWTTLFDGTIDNLGLELPVLTIDTTGSDYKIDVMIAINGSIDSVIFENLYQGIYNASLQDFALQNFSNFQIRAKWDIPTMPAGSALPINNAVFAWGSFGGFRSVLNFNYDEAERVVLVTGVDDCKVAEWAMPVITGLSLDGDGGTSAPLKINNVAVAGDERRHFDAAFIDADAGEPIYATFKLADKTISGFVVKTAALAGLQDSYEITGIATMATSAGPKAVQYIGIMPGDQDYVTWTRVDTSAKQLVIPSSGLKSDWIVLIENEEIKSGDVFFLRDEADGLTGFGKVTGPRSPGGSDYRLQLFAMSADGTQLLSAFSDYDDATTIDFDLFLSHNDMLGRDEDDCHPISAITDLEDELDSKIDESITDETDGFLVGNIVITEGDDDNEVVVTKTMLGIDGDVDVEELKIKATNGLLLTLDSDELEVSGEPLVKELERLDNDKVYKGFAQATGHHVVGDLDVKIAPTMTATSPRTKLNLIKKRVFGAAVNAGEVTDTIDMYSVDATAGDLNFTPISGGIGVTVPTKVSKSFAKETGNKVIGALDLRQVDRETLRITRTSVKTDVNNGESVKEDFEFDIKVGDGLFFETNKKGVKLHSCTQVNETFADETNGFVIGDITVAREDSETINVHKIAVDVTTKYGKPEHKSYDYKITAGDGIQFAETAEGVEIDASRKVNETFADPTHGFAIGDITIDKVDQNEITIHKIALDVTQPYGESDTREYDFVIGSSTGDLEFDAKSALEIDITVPTKMDKAPFDGDADMVKDVFVDQDGPDLVVTKTLKDVLTGDERDVELRVTSEHSDVTMELDGDELKLAVPTKIDKAAIRESGNGRKQVVTSLEPVYNAAKSEIELIMCSSDVMGREGGTKDLAGAGDISESVKIRTIGDVPITASIEGTTPVFTIDASRKVNNDFAGPENYLLQNIHFTDVPTKTVLKAMAKLAFVNKPYGMPEILEFPRDIFMDDGLTVELEGYNMRIGAKPMLATLQPKLTDDEMIAIRHAVRHLVIRDVENNYVVKLNEGIEWDDMGIFRNLMQVRHATGINEHLLLGNTELPTIFGGTLGTMGCNVYLGAFGEDHQVLPKAKIDLMITAALAKALKYKGSAKESVIMSWTGDLYTDHPNFDGENKWKGTAIQNGDFWYVTDFDVTKPGTKNTGHAIYNSATKEWEIDIDTARLPDNITLNSDSEGRTQIKPKGVSKIHLDDELAEALEGNDNVKKSTTDYTGGDILGSVSLKALSTTAFTVTRKILDAKGDGLNNRTDVFKGSAKGGLVFDWAPDGMVFDASGLFTRNEVVPNGNGQRVLTVAIDLKPQDGVADPDKLQIVNWSHDLETKDTHVFKKKIEASGGIHFKPIVAGGSMTGVSIDGSDLVNKSFADLTNGWVIGDLVPTQTNGTDPAPANTIFLKKIAVSLDDSKPDNVYHYPIGVTGGLTLSFDPIDGIFIDGKKKVDNTFAAGTWNYVVGDFDAMPVDDETLKFKLTKVSPKGDADAVYETTLTSPDIKLAVDGVKREISFTIPTKVDKDSIQVSGNGRRQVVTALDAENGAANEVLVHMYTSSVEDKDDDVETMAIKAVGGLKAAVKTTGIEIDGSGKIEKSIADVGVPGYSDGFILGDLWLNKSGDDIRLDKFKLSVDGAPLERQTATIRATGGLAFGFGGSTTDPIVDIDGSALVAKSFAEKTDGIVITDTLLLKGKTKFAVVNDDEEKLFIRVAKANVDGSAQGVWDVPIGTEGDISIETTTVVSGGHQYIKDENVVTSIKIKGTDPKYTVGKTFQVNVPAGAGLATAVIPHNLDSDNVFVSTREDDDESVFGDEFPITRTDGNSKNSVTLEFPKGAAPRTWFVNVKAAAEPEAIVVNAI